MRFCAGIGFCRLLSGSANQHLRLSEPFEQECEVVSCGGQDSFDGIDLAAGEVTVHPVFDLDADSSHGTYSRLRVWLENQFPSASCDMLLH